MEDRTVVSVVLCGLVVPPYGCKAYVTRLSQRTLSRLPSSGRDSEKLMDGALDDSDLGVLTRQLAVVGVYTREYGRCTTRKISRI